MSTETSVLIVTDATESVNSIAESIKSGLTGFDVKIRTAESFEGTDILPCEIFFLGCETPKPQSFAYIEEMLSHINFASRKCGIFSVNTDAVNYLKGILESCEATVFEPFVVSGKVDTKTLKSWLGKITG